MGRQRSRKGRKKTDKRLQKTGKRAKKTGKRVQVAGKRLQKTGKTAKKTDRRVQKTGKTAKKTGERVQKTGKRVQKTGKGLQETDKRKADLKLLERDNLKNLPSDKLLVQLDKDEQEISSAERKLGKYRRMSDTLSDLHDLGPNSTKRLKLQDKKAKYESIVKETQALIDSKQENMKKCKHLLQDRLDEIMEKTVSYLENKSLVVGGAGVGKSHLVALSLNRDPPSLRVSTSCAEMLPYVLSNIQVCQDTASFEVLTEERYTIMLMESASVTEDISSKSNSKSKKNHSSQRMLTSVDKLLLNMQSKMKFTNFLHGKVLGRIVDTAGQPQLLELLPRFISGMSLGIVVIDLSQRLAAFPEFQFYGKDGNPVGNKIQSYLTNEHITRLFLQMIISTTKKKIQIMIVGTHKDVEHRSLETREQKETKIKEIIITSGLEDNVIYTDETHSSLIHAVNALNPTKEDHDVGQKIMTEALKKSSAERTTIPIKHRKLELTLKMLSEQSKKIALSFTEVFDHMRCHYANHRAMQEGLKLLHHSFRIFYFPDLPDLIFGEPQLLLDFMTTISKHHIQIVQHPKQSTSSSGIWKKFKEQGIITKKILLDIFSNDFDDNFTAEIMLTVMVKLLIACKLGEDKYLMPSLLEAKIEWPLTRQSTSSSWWFTRIIRFLFKSPNVAATMLIHFPNSLVRFGIVCATVCELVSKYHWELKSDVARNIFCFTQPSCTGTITLIDSFDSFIAVDLKTPENLSSNSLSSICSNVRDILFKVISDVNKELEYSKNEPVIGFICDHHKNSWHAAEYIKEHQHLLCTKDTMKTNPISDRHSFWLKDIPPYMNQKVHRSNSGTRTNTDSLFKHYVQMIPKKKQKHLRSEIESDTHIRRMAKKITHWEEKFDVFNLDSYDVFNIKHGHNRGRPILQQMEVLHSWRNIESPDDTYENLLKVFVEGKFTDSAKELVDIVTKM